MAKTGTTGYYARLARRKIDRKIKALQKSLTQALDQRQTEYAKKQIRELESERKSTYQFNPKTHKRIEGRNSETIATNLERINTRIAYTKIPTQQKGDTFATTQNELNKANVGLPSVYSKTEVGVFYKATQKLWQDSDLKETNRNRIIEEEFNKRLVEVGKPPMTFAEIVDYTLKQFETATSALDLINADAEDEMTEEQAAFAEKLKGADESDNRSGSPIGVSKAVMNAIRSAFNDLFEVTI